MAQTYSHLPFPFHGLQTPPGDGRVFMRGAHAYGIGATVEEAWGHCSCAPNEVDLIVWVPEGSDIRINEIDGGVIWTNNCYPMWKRTNPGRTEWPTGDWSRKGLDQMSAAADVLQTYGEDCYDDDDEQPDVAMLIQSLGDLASQILASVEIK